jgi:hypothetical protein
MILTNETNETNNNNNNNSININTISNNNTLEQSIEGISTIQKDEQNDTELEEYIKKCLNTISLKKKQNKSILKSSKSNILKIKKEILSIFKDNSELIKYFSLIQERNDKDLHNSILNANKIFEEEIDELYNWKLNEINKINEEFNNDLFEMKDLSEEENRFKILNNNNNENNNNVDSNIYNQYNNNNNNNVIAENPFHYDADIQINDNNDDILNSEENKIQLKDENNIPEIYLCPISLQLMTDPVINPYGITYNRDSIEKWLKKSDKDPVTKKKLTKNMLFPNYALKSLIEEYIKENKI